MAKFIGGTSKYLIQQKFYYMLGGYLLMICLVVALLWYWVFILHFVHNIWVILTATIVFLIVYKVITYFVNDGMKHEFAFGYGITGEAKVAEELNRLPASYTVIQDVKLSDTKTNIDFVVLGPNGIWAVEVKSHKGNITYDGSRLLRYGRPLEKNFIGQSRLEATALTDYLQSHIDRHIYVDSLLVFSSPKATMRFGEHPIQDVVIIGASWLNRHILEHQSQIKFTPQDIDQIARVLQLEKIDGSKPAMGVK